MAGFSAPGGPLGSPEAGECPHVPSAGAMSSSGILWAEKIALTVQGDRANLINYALTKCRNKEHVMFAASRVSLELGEVDNARK